MNARTLLERLEALRDKSGPYGRLIRDAASDLRTSNEQLHAALERTKKAEAAWAGEPRHACEWCVDDDGVWYTGCGHAWQFENGGPKENSVRWCQYCGGRLAAQPKEPAA